MGNDEASVMTATAGYQSVAESLASLAASRERASINWNCRFSELFASRALGVHARPGSTVAVHIRSCPFDDDIDRVANFCAEHIEVAERNGLSLGIDFSEVAAPDFCGWLDRLLEKLSVTSTGERDGLMISLHSGHHGVRALLDLHDRHTALNINVAIRYDVSATTRCDWQKLVESSHGNESIKLVPANTGRALSGLHAVEKANSVLPGGLFEARSDTAWLLLEVDATRLGHPLKLRRQLADSLRLADNLIDETVWPRPALNVDALLNRRVAVHIGRIGDLLRMRGYEPGTDEAFAWLKRWLRFVRNSFTHESMLLARQRGPFPQLGADELITQLTPYYGRQDAVRLVRNRFLRHRHILALSPFAIIPEEFATQEEDAWLNLLPAISCADVLTMQGPDPRKKMTLQGWKRLLHITGALTACKRVITYK